MKDGSVRLFLFILGLLGLSWPLIASVRLSVVLYVFALWSVVILLAFAVQRLWERQVPESGSNRPPR